MTTLRSWRVQAIVLASAFSMFVGGAQARITSTDSDRRLVISAPDSAEADGVCNDTHQIGFDEQQGVLLLQDLRVHDPNRPATQPAAEITSIPAGTVVDSHMILFNHCPGNSDFSELITRWRFNRPILGTMTDINGLFEALSTPVLGAPNTRYETFTFRGMEGNDFMALDPDNVGNLNLLRVRMGIRQNGDFIRIVSSGRLRVKIDVKPGSDPNCFNVNSHGVIPVAILGSDIFDVSKIDQSTLKFGALEVRMRGNQGPQCSIKDIDGDGNSDLVCQFEDDSAMWEPNESDTTATLTGVAAGTVLFPNVSIEFRGSDAICVRP